MVLDQSIEFIPHEAHEVCKSFCCSCCDLLVKLQLIMQECLVQDQDDVTFFVFREPNGQICMAGPLGV